MKAYGEVDVQIHIFLTSTLVAGECSDSRTGCLTHGEKSPWYQLDRKLSEPQSQSGRRGGEKILQPTGTRTLIPRSSNP
jgi:hypothetical protein